MLNLKNTLDGYLKNVEVIGNTVQDTNNLANIRSVGDKVEGQELYKIDVVSCGKNLNKSQEFGRAINQNGEYLPTGNSNVTDYCSVKEGTYYTTSINGVPRIVNQFYYDKDKKLISKSATPGSTFTIPQGAKYVRFTFGTTQEGLIQLEEGTQVTPYESYQEQKLEILSPVQLEKVGDVVDRIICKDGVWGVESNITKVNLKDLSFVIYSETNDMIVFNSNINVKQKGNFYGISNKLIYSSSAWNNSIIEDSIGLDSTSSRIFVKFRKSTISTLKEFNKFKEDLFLLYQRDVCEFISLPHDQQVKLRTFAGQTNIAFLTEIPGQIKAQVPKSLGATVNTHTEQIADLHNSLDRVKKLEETTVSTIETVSGFTTVNETSNGYFEDVKLEGKTLVNKSLIKSKHIISSGDRLCKVFLGQNLPQFTLIVDVSNLNGTLKSYGIYADNNQEVYTQSTDVNGKWITYFNLNKPIKEFTLYVDGGTNHKAILDNIVVLEGDHTNNPPEYFEGLMSAGQDVEEVSIESSTSFFSYNNLEVGGTHDSNGLPNYTQQDRYRAKELIYIGDINKLFVECDEKYSIVTLHFYDINKKFLGYKIDNTNPKIQELPTGTRYINYVIRHRNSDGILPTLPFDGHINICNGDNVRSGHNKKPLLYFNPTTETWEKPTLREWDSIEKHSDGKYYYHKRSGEIVLNGSQNTMLHSSTFDNVLWFKTPVSGIKHNSTLSIKCDKFTPSETWGDVECVQVNASDYIFTSISKAKLSTQDVAGFKQWLQSNPTTVVYQLAQEEVYECTNIDLMTYSGETNYIINSGAISPKSLLKVHNNISNVVKILQEKVSLLENTFIAGLKSVLSGDMYSLATILYPEDFEQNDNTEQDIMVIPE